MTVDPACIRALSLANTTLDTEAQSVWVVIMQDIFQAVVHVRRLGLRQTEAFNP